MHLIHLVCACTCFFCIHHHSNANSHSCINFLFYLPNYCSVAGELASELLDRNMMPKIADFGFSKLIVASTDTYRTESQLKGTP